jgi:cyclophilin family peptidyl-prolyl cis-trans isomerase
VTRLKALLPVLFTLALLLWPARATAQSETLTLSEERIILRTVAGDMVLVLYPEVAPRTVEQILKLVRAGVYDTTAFVRIEPGFVAQLSAHHDRTVPINDQQQALVHPIAAELTKVKHVRGVLSMAREDGNVDSAETSFSILLGPAPHLDGKYTVFGRLESGEAVLEEMVKVPRGVARRPVVRLEVTRAEVVASSALASASLEPAHAVAVPEEAMRLAEHEAVVAAAGESAAGGEGVRGDVSSAVAFGFGFICFIGIVSFFLQGRVPTSIHGSLNLLMVLVGAFMIVVVLIPKGHQSPWLAAALFFGLIGLFKLLGRFESPAGK